MYSVSRSLQYCKPEPARRPAVPERAAEEVDRQAGLLHSLHASRPRHRFRGIYYHAVRAPLIPYAGTVLLATGLVALARVLPGGPAPSREPAAAPKKTSAPLAFLLAGVLGAVGHFVMSWVAPETGLLTIAEVCAAILVVQRLVGRFSFSEINKWSIAAGALLFFIALALLVEMDGNRKDDAGGWRSWVSRRRCFSGWFCCSCCEGARGAEGRLSPSDASGPCPRCPSADPRGSS